MAMTPLDTPPSKTDPANFASRADALLTALPTFVAEANALEANVVAKEASTVAAADTATTAASTATTKAAEAAASSLTAVNAPGTSATSTTSLTVGMGSKALTIQTGKAFAVGQTVVMAYTTTPTTRMIGAITAHDSGTGALTVNVALAEGSIGSTYTAWSIALEASPSATAASIKRSARTSNTILGAADKGKLIDITSGTFTQTFEAAATLGDGWWCYVGNSGTGFVTLDPNASETVTVNGTGLSAWVLWPREMGLLVCDGTGLYYYCVQRGEITQTISSPVASVSFATGLARRRRLSLSIENLACSAADDIAIKVNDSAADSPHGYWMETYSGTAYAGVSPGRIVGSAGVKANATGSQRLAASIGLNIGTGWVQADHRVTYSDSGARNAASIGHHAWTSITEATISSISVVSNYTLTAGTFILREE